MILLAAPENFGATHGTMKLKAVEESRKIDGVRNLEMAISFSL